MEGPERSPLPSLSEADRADRGGWQSGQAGEYYGLVRRDSGQLERVGVAIHPSAWKGNSANFACTEFSKTRRLTILRSAPIDRTIVNRFRPNWVQLGPVMISVVDPCSR